MTSTFSLSGQIRHILPILTFGSVISDSFVVVVVIVVVVVAVVVFVVVIVCCCCCS